MIHENSLQNDKLLIGLQIRFKEEEVFLQRQLSGKESKSVHERDQGLPNGKVGTNGPVVYSVLNDSRVLLPNLAIQCIEIQYILDRLQRMGGVAFEIDHEFDA